MIFSWTDQVIILDRYGYFHEKLEDFPEQNDKIANEQIIKFSWTVQGIFLNKSGKFPELQVRYLNVELSLFGLNYFRLNTWNFRHSTWTFLSVWLEKALLKQKVYGYTCALSILAVLFLDKQIFQKATNSEQLTGTHFRYRQFLCHAHAWRMHAYRVVLVSGIQSYCLYASWSN